jgi:hypothetical protein
MIVFLVSIPTPIAAPSPSHRRVSPVLSSLAAIHRLESQASSSKVTVWKSQLAPRRTRLVAAPAAASNRAVRPPRARGR